MVEQGSHVLEAECESPSYGLRSVPCEEESVGIRRGDNNKPDFSHRQILALIHVGSVNRCALKPLG
eukprot:CAMPEP_0196574170 /NCGR_PEP_ID=MMETSP1081-20130531/3946_1 /TAXON_ID=36882 /ORGANISM="Pyramimonas amylifera, Strain CCMP720" /LENGTH=65 /DNA_ID=CAMNT_0041892115 /DNA_START=69 /DNA_END=266 /DNA_ORIENTATION=-